MAEALELAVALRLMLKLGLPWCVPMTFRKGRCFVKAAKVWVDKREAVFCIFSIVLFVSTSSLNL